MYKAVTMASMKEIFTHLPYDDIAIRSHAPASVAITSDFCFGKPIAGSRKNLEEKWNAVEVPSWLHTRPPKGAGGEKNTYRKDIEALATTAKPLDQLKIPEEVLQWEKKAPEDFPASAFGHHGPVSKLSVSNLSKLFCTGPFNWGKAHCAGEKVKQSSKEDHYNEVSS